MCPLRITKCIQWSKWLVSAFWFVGIALGYCLATIVPDVSIAMVNQISRQEPSVVGLLFSTVTPLLIAFFAVKLRKRFALLTVLLIKAFSFSFCAVCVLLAFNDAGWLLYRFYLFSNSCSTVVLTWFCFRYINGDHTDLLKHFLYCILTVFLILLIDIILVAPFVWTLFNN